MKLLVFDILDKGQNAFFHGDGLALFGSVKDQIENGQTAVEISFENIRVCTTQFLNASFGKLMMTYGEDFVTRHITVSSYDSINAFEGKYHLARENFKEKNRPFIEEAYA